MSVKSPSNTNKLNSLATVAVQHNATQHNNYNINQHVKRLPVTKLPHCFTTAVWLQGKADLQVISLGQLDIH